MPFGAASFYTLLLKEMNVVSGEITQPIYADLHSVRRSPDGDAFNALSMSGRDSSLVLGQAYVPPTTFLGLDMTMVCGSLVSVIRSSFPIANNIVVSPPPLPAPPWEHFSNFRNHLKPARFR